MSSPRYMYEECYYGTGRFEFLFKPTSVLGQPITWTLEEASKSSKPSRE